MGEHIHLDAMLFFDRVPQMLPVYQALDQRLNEAGFSGVGVRVQKTQITYRNRHVFACVSLPARKLKGHTGPYLLVTFGLGYRLASPRIAVAVEPYPNRWTHHVAVSTPEEIDDELMGWIREAYEFSMAK